MAHFFMVICLMMSGGALSSGAWRQPAKVHPKTIGKRSSISAFALAPLRHLGWFKGLLPDWAMALQALFLKLSAMSTIQTQGTEEVHPDVALVERARAGDTAAYEKLVRQYDRQVFRIAQHITQNREDAEDVVQDAFLKAYEKLDQFQGNSKFYTWLVRIAVNESLMRLRKRRTGKMVSIDEDVETEEGSMPRDLADWSPDPEAQYTQSEMAEILKKTIQGLPPGFRVVFVLRDVDGLSTEETAETLGLSVPAVKSRLLRARLQLRERLSRYFRKNGKDGAK
jgi:RNA polymerase sigma-70 factor (ECF subfamily)